MIAVPFDGEGDVFKYQASTRTFNPPRAQVHGSELHLTWAGEGPASNPVAVRQHLDNEIDKIEQHLSWSRNDIERYDADLRTSITSRDTQRRAKLLADRNLRQVSGFPFGSSQTPRSTRYR